MLLFWYSNFTAIEIGSSKLNRPILSLKKPKKAKVEQGEPKLLKKPIGNHPPQLRKYICSRVRLAGEKATDLPEFKLLESKADADDFNAIICLVMFYREGIDVEKDLVLAVKLCERAQEIINSCKKQSSENHRRNEKLKGFMFTLTEELTKLSSA